jgi:hypothetical protein
MDRSTTSPQNLGFEEMKAQRDQALACFILAGSISLAVVFSVFGPTPQIDAARGLVETHRKLEQESRLVLAQNQAALAEVQKALAGLKSGAGK